MRQSFARPTASSASRSVSPGHNRPIQQQPTRERQPQNEFFTRTEPIPAEPLSTKRRNSILEPPSKEYYRFLAERRSPAYLINKRPCEPILMAEHVYRAPKPMDGPRYRIRANVDGHPRTSGSSNVSAPSEEPFRQDIALPEPEPTPLPRREPPGLLTVQAAKNLFESKASQSQIIKPHFPQTEASAMKGGRVKEQIQKFQPSSSSRQSKDLIMLEHSPSPTGAPAVQDTDSSRSAPHPNSPLNHPNQGQLAQRINPFVRSTVKGWRNGLITPRQGRLDVDRSRRTSRTTDDIGDPPVLAKGSTISGQRRNSE